MSCYLRYVDHIFPHTCTLLMKKTLLNIFLKIQNNKFPFLPSQILNRRNKNDIHQHIGEENPFLLQLLTYRRTGSFVSPEQFHALEYPIGTESRRLYLCIVLEKNRFQIQQVLFEDLQYQFSRFRMSGDQSSFIEAEDTR